MPRRFSALGPFCAGLAAALFIALSGEAAGEEGLPTVAEQARLSLGDDLVPEIRWLRAGSAFDGGTLKTLGAQAPVPPTLTPSAAAPAAAAPDGAPAVLPGRPDPSFSRKLESGWGSSPQAYASGGPPPSVPDNRPSDYQDAGAAGMGALGLGIWLWMKSIKWESARNVGVALILIGYFVISGIG